MVHIPNELARAIQSGDCVLWVGAGFGALAGRPSWEQLLRRLLPACAEKDRPALTDLIEQGRWRTVLTYVHRHHGDEPLAAVLKEVSAEAESAEIAEGASKLSELPWRACFATTYADLVARILGGGSDGKGPKCEVLSHGDAHHLSLRDHKDLFVLRTPPTGRAMRADGVFFDLVEEVVRTRTILFLGFDPDDPDLIQILDLLDRVGRGNTHYALLPWVTPPEAEELKDRFAIEVIPGAADRKLPELFSDLASACADVAVRPSGAEDKLTMLDLGRVVRGVELRADLAIDEALAIDIAWVEHLMDALPGGGLGGLSAATLLRTGAVLLAHGRVDRARRCFQQVITQGAGREFSNLARFNLAYTAAIEGDRAAALDGLASAAEHDRSLAVVPPRFALQEVLGRTGTGLLLLCRDRETKVDYEVAVAQLARPVGEQEHARFHEAVKKLAAIDHPAVRGVKGGFADGRLFGVMREPTPGILLADNLEGETPMPLDKAHELIAPLGAGLSACHDAGVLHRNINPSNVLVGKDGAVFRGFGFPPVIGFARPSVRSANAGYIAPEVLAGGEATKASDLYSLAALCYRMVSGRAPAGAVPPASVRNAELDPRVDALLVAALHPEPAKRPSLASFREQLDKIVATPEIGRAQRLAAEGTTPGQEKVVDLGVPKATTERGSGAVAVPQAIEEAVSAPLGARIVLPEDPNDLEAWAWILERKPTHLEARAAVARIESEAREALRWDRVAEAVKVRMQHSQIARERIDMMREVASIYETKLGAPGNAFEITQALIEELPPGEQHTAIADLRRLAEITASWSQFADSLMIVAERTTDAAAQAALFEELGKLFAEKLGATERALAAYEKANEIHPSAALWAAVIPLYRKADRDADLVGAMLSLADLQTGPERHGTLVAAAKVLRETLGDEEGALGAIEVVLAEDADHAEALVAAESMARSLERTATLVDILARRGQASLDDNEASAALREAAGLAKSLGEPDRHIDLLQKALRRRPDDRDTTAKLVETLRPLANADAARRTALIDALSTWVDLQDVVTDKAAVLVELAGLLDQEVDGKERAADSRERVLELLPIEHPIAHDAAGNLAKWYRRQEDHAALDKLLVRQGSAKDADDAVRVDAWSRVLELRKTTQAGDAAIIDALEKLGALAPTEAKWRDELLERYLATEDFAKAGPLIRAQVDAETDPKRKAELLLRGGILRQELGKTEGAVDALEQAVALDPTLTDAWLQLRELYTANGQPLKAIEAQVNAARSHVNRVEKVKMLFEAGKKYVDELDKPDRGLALLEEVVEQDPDHREATGILLERLVAQGDLARAWPQAQIYVMQVRSQQGSDNALNLRALSLAGRCALAVENKERAREYLEKARTLDATNLDVLRLLAELDMEAGRFADALRHYQSVVLGVGDKLAPGELSRLYLRMADARIGMDEAPKAVQMLERAIDIDNDNEDAVDRLVELGVRAGGPASVVKAKRRLVDLLARREQRSDDAATKAELRGRRITQLQEISRLQVDELKLLEEGVRTLEEVLQLTPDDPAVLHKILDLFTASKRWRDATNVLGRLADAQKNDVIKAKYLYAGGAILRTETDDLAAAKQWLARALEADPTHERAWTSYVEVLEKSRDYKELGRALRGRLKALPEGGPPAKPLELFSKLGEVYEALSDPKTALMAFHQAARLAQAAGEGEEAVRKRHEKAMKLAISLGDDELDKAISHGHAIVAAAPTEFETYHRLVELYLKMNRKDRARAIARTLKFLKQADEAEIELADGGQASQARGTISREVWRQAVYPAGTEARLCDLFAMVWPVVAAREGRTVAHHRLRRDARTEVSIQSPTPIARYLAHACQVLDAPVPDLYIREDELGGFKVDTLADGDGANRTIHPSVLAGRDAVAETGEAGLKFRTGRVIARAKPEHILSAILTSPGLRNTVWGAVAATNPEAKVPTDCKSEAAAYAELMQKFLQASRLDQVRQIAGKIVRSGDVDTRPWFTAMAYTTARAGFVICDNLEVAAAILTREGDEGSPVSAKDRVRDLVAFSVSEGYMRIRKDLNFGK